MVSLLVLSSSALLKKMERLVFADSSPGAMALPVLVRFVGRRLFQANRA
jgi:hypothetical protein